MATAAATAVPHVRRLSVWIMGTATIVLPAVMTLFRRHRLNFPPTLGIFLQTTPLKSSGNVILVRSSDPKREQQQLTSDDAFTSQEDLGYLWKLGAGSVIGAAAIKYGSVLFPAITKPNIVEALIIICVPVIVAVLLLFNQSRIEE